MIDKTGGPAFAHGNPEQGGDPGMTLRDYFAGQALAGFLSNPNIAQISDVELAATTYQAADAMIAEREKS